MKVSPLKLKKELDALLRDLNRARTRESKTLDKLEDGKRKKLMAGALVELESKYLTASRDVSNIEKEMKGIRLELMGDWAPKNLESANAC